MQTNTTCPAAQTPSASAEKVLEYWFAMEFLAQDSFPNGREVREKVRKYKKNGRIPASVNDALTVKPEEMTREPGEMIREEALALKMSECGNITVYVGRIRREGCIDVLSRVLPRGGEDANARPEKNQDRIAMASLQLSANGSYVEGSLSISTILWAMNQLSGSGGGLTDVLDPALYEEEVKKLEKELFGTSEGARAASGAEEGPSNEFRSGVQGFAENAVTWSNLKRLFVELENRYLRRNYAGEMEKFFCEEICFLEFQLFQDLEAKAKNEEDHYLGLSHDYFSNDIRLVLEKVKTGDLKSASGRPGNSSAEIRSASGRPVSSPAALGSSSGRPENASGMERDLYRYITCLCENHCPARFDIVSPPAGQRKEYLRILNEILDIANAPLGKWPSRFMPAFMQQVAINLSVKRGTSDIFGVNGQIFSVNGPPGTGKTTLLKEIIVNQVVERAVLLAEYKNPDDAFESCDFRHGEKQDHAYDKFIRHWYRLKNEKINDYGMLVLSCNNAAVENISKELPMSVQGDLKPAEGDSGELQAALREVADSFCPEKNGHTERTRQGEEYQDLYFTRYARELLGDQNAWGLIAIPLGKKSNVNDFYYKVLSHLLWDFYPTKNSAADRRSSYLEAREAFLRQLQVVNDQKEAIGKACGFLREVMACSERKKTLRSGKEEAARALQAEARQHSVRRQNRDREQARLQAALQEEQTKINRLREEMAAQEAASRQVKARQEELSQKIEENQKNLTFFNKVLLKEKYKNSGNLIDEYNREKERLREEAEKIEQAMSGLENSLKEAEAAAKTLEEEEQRLERTWHSMQASLSRKEEDYARQNRELQELDSRQAEAEQKYLQAIKIFGDTDMDSGIPLDLAYLDRLLSESEEESTKAQVDSPWFTQRYNREREKLFALAMRLNKEFVLSTNHCRDNFKTLAQYWGLLANDDKEKVAFHEEDRLRMVPALYQTLLLLVPVVSSTFASVGNLLKDVRQSGALGTMIVDEAGQAQPQMAVGALYRCRKAIIVGDPKQVEPVVTDDLALLKRAYRDDVLLPYQEKTISVQSLADQLNAMGTWLENGSDEPDWVGSPLLVHRRCISPMYDISNQLSYNGIMKQQTRPPKGKNFVRPKSEWIHVYGKEEGNKNHFVPQQGDKVCELLEDAFALSPEPGIYIISPFTSVVEGIKKHIRKYCKEHPQTKIIPNYMLNPDQKRIGTVHTFQGKEADEVIFLLGCDSSREAAGAIRWVNRNIVNVAVTRAKYRLYIVGDADAWRQSVCVNQARQIMETYAIRQIRAIQEKGLSEEETQTALREMSQNLPSVTSFPVAETETDEAGGVDYSPNTEGFLSGLDQEFRSYELDTEQLEKFGFHAPEELNLLEKDVRDNLLLGMKLFYLLRPVYEANKKLDASCCAILFCKAMELHMKNCFTRGFQAVLPEFQIRGQGKNRSRVPFREAKNSELTLGTFCYVIANNTAALGECMEKAGKKKYDAKWWEEFGQRLHKCAELRNNCCHSGLFDWQKQSWLLAYMFTGRQEPSEPEMAGLMFEANVGKELV